MRTRVIAFIVIAAGAGLMTQWAAEPGASNVPEYTKDNQLILPSHYREWIFLSSGLGMTYGPVAEANRDMGPMFDNVFVTPAAYHSFLETGKWPGREQEVDRDALGQRTTGRHFRDASGTATTQGEAAVLLVMT